MLCCVGAEAGRLVQNECRRLLQELLHAPALQNSNISAAFQSGAGGTFPPIAQCYTHIRGCRPARMLQQIRVCSSRLLQKSWDGLHTSASTADKFLQGLLGCEAHQKTEAL